MANPPTNNIKTEEVGKKKNSLEKILSESPTTKEKTIELLKRFENAGGGIKDILYKSPFGKSLSIYSNGIRYMSIKSAIIDLQKKKDIKEEKEEVKKEEKKDKKLKSEEKKKNRKVVDLKEYKKEKEESKKSKEEEIEELERMASEELIKNEEIKTEKERIDELSKKKAEIMGVEVDASIEIDSKRTIIEAELLVNDKIKEVRKLRKENFEKRWEEELIRLNPNINDEELADARKYKELVSHTYYDDLGMEDQMYSILEDQSGINGMAGGQLENTWTDVEGVIKLLRQGPAKIKKIKFQYEQLKKRLKHLKKPNIREAKSFDKIVGFLKNKDVNDLFNIIGQSKILTWIDRIDKVTGGWLRKVFAKWAAKFVTKVGNQTVKTFMTNAMGAIAKNGFRKGIVLALKSLFTKAATKVGTKVAVAGASKAVGAAGGPWAWLIIAIITVAKFIKKHGGKLARKLGIDTGLKESLQDSLGRGAGWVMHKVIKGIIIVVAIPTLIATMVFGPILMIIGVVSGGLFGNQMMQNNLVSSVVPPIEKTGSGGGGYGDNNYGLIIGAGISVPDCDPSVHNKGIIRDIALSIEGKVHYNRDFGKYWYCMGPCPGWNTKNRGLSRTRYPYHGMDCAKFVSWVWLQCIGKERRERTNELGSSSYLYNYARSGKNGWKLVYLDNKDQLEVGDILYKLGHASIYIGKNENGEGQVMETDNNFPDPHIDTVREIIDNKVVVNDFNYRAGKKTYTSVIRITSVFNEENND